MLPVALRAWDLGSLGPRIAEARKLLKPDHPMWTDQNIGIKDRLTYVVKNCPSGTSASDIVKAMNQLEWPVLPQRQLNKGATCTWWISAEGKPKVWYFQWSGQSIVIEAEDPTRLTAQRRDQNKRKAIGERRMEDEQKRGTPSVGGKADPLEHRDPWGNWSKPRRETEGSSQSSTASGSASVVLVGSHPAPGAVGQDPKIAALSARVEALESNAVKVDQKVGVLDRKVDDMSANMTSQFRDVLSAIAALSKSQNGDDPKRKKQEGSPTS